MPPDMKHECKGA